MNRVDGCERYISEGVKTTTTYPHHDIAACEALCKIKDRIQVMFVKQESEWERRSEDALPARASISGDWTRITPKNTAGLGLVSIPAINRPLPRELLQSSQPHAPIYATIHYLFPKWPSHHRFAPVYQWGAQALSDNKVSHLLMFLKSLDLSRQSFLCASYNLFLRYGKPSQPGLSRIWCDVHSEGVVEDCGTIEGF